MKHLLVLLLTVTSGAAFAQTTVTVGPSPSPAEPSMKEDVPPGGCMPIGLTASGEIVFPIQCKEFIERQRGQAVERKPAAVEERPRCLLARLGKQRLREARPGRKAIGRRGVSEPQ